MAYSSESAMNLQNTLLTAALGLTISAMTAIAAAIAPPAYTATTIPLLAGYNVMRPTALNNAGDVVGVASNTTGSPAAHTFLYQGGKVRDLGALGTPIAINVFGAILTRSGLYQGGRLVASAPIESSFAGLNDIGQIIGGGNVGDGDNNSFQPKSGFLRQPNGTIVPLAFNGLAAYPVAINNVGQIVADYNTPNNLPGFASKTGNLHRVVLFQAGGRNGVDIGTLGFWTFAGGLNIWGQVVGNSQILENSVDDIYEAPVEAVSYSGGTLTDLEGLFGYFQVSEATAINDFGVIIGTTANIFGAGSTAGVYSGGVWYNLSEVTSGLPSSYVGDDYFFTGCVAINDEGVIIAVAQTETYPLTADYFLLTPAKAARTAKSPVFIIQRNAPFSEVRQ